MKHNPRIESIYKDYDGWWVEYKPGWQSSNDPGCHGEHENTKREVMELVRMAEPCNCADCRAILNGPNNRPE